MKSHLIFKLHAAPLMDPSSLAHIHSVLNTGGGVWRILPPLSGVVLPTFTGQRSVHSLPTRLEASVRLVHVDMVRRRGSLIFIILCVILQDTDRSAEVATPTVRGVGGVAHLVNIMVNNTVVTSRHVDTEPTLVNFTLVVVNLAVQHRLELLQVFLIIIIINRFIITTFIILISIRVYIHDGFCNFYTSGLKGKIHVV